MVAQDEPKPSVRLASAGISRPQLKPSPGHKATLRRQTSEPAGEAEIERSFRGPLTRAILRPVHREASGSRSATRSIHPRRRPSSISAISMPAGSLAGAMTEARAPSPEPAPNPTFAASASTCARSNRPMRARPPLVRARRHARLMGEMPRSLARRRADAEAATGKAGRDWFAFVICLIADDRPIGRADIFEIDRYNGSAGFGLAIGEHDVRGAASARRPSTSSSTSASDSSGSSASGL